MTLMFEQRNAKSLFRGHMIYQLKIFLIICHRQNSRQSIGDTDMNESFCKLLSNVIMQRKKEVDKTFLMQLKETGEVFIIQIQGLLCYG